MKRIGIIGGMGAAATADLFLKIIEESQAKSDQEQIPLLIDNNTAIPDRTAYILDNSLENPYPYLKESALRLEKGDCQAFCMACNTAHYFAEDLEKEVNIKVLHIAKIAIEALKKEKNIKKVAIIGTKGTRDFGIYSKELEKAGFSEVQINDKDEEIIMEAIYKGAKAGKIEAYKDKLNALINSIEADKFIAACTEIPLFLPYLDKKDAFIDSTQELAKEIVAYSRGK